MGNLIGIYYTRVTQTYKTVKHSIKAVRFNLDTLIEQSDFGNGL